MSTHSWFGDAVRSKNRQMELEAERRLVAEKNNARLQAAEALLREARGELHVIGSYQDDPGTTAGLRATARAYTRLIEKIDTFLNGGAQ